MQTISEAEQAERLAFLQKIGLDPKRLPRMYIPEVEKMQGVLDGFVEYGFTQEEAKRVVQRFPQQLSASRIITCAALHAYESRGFSKDEVRKMTLRWPSILVYTQERNDLVLGNLEAYGFTEAEIRRMVKLLPAVMCYTPERTNGLLANLEAAGFDRVQVIDIIRRIPSVLCMTAKRTNEAIAAIRSVGLDPFDRPNILVRAPYMTRGRIAFLRMRGYEVTLQQLSKSHERFATQWGVDRDDVIALDPLRAQRETAPE